MSASPSESVRVRYAAAPDGVRLAFTVVGTGPAVVYTPPIPLRHCELEWQLPEDRQWMERLGRDRRLIEYDPRGLGLSGGDLAGSSLDEAASDFGAVMDAAGAEQAAIFACVNTAPIAIAYAVARPERVSHLILWCATARATEGVPRQVAMLLELAEQDWELATEAAARVMVGWSADESASRYAHFMRTCFTPESARAVLATQEAFDAAARLAQVRTPTLVLHRRDLTWVPLASAVALASGIPDARLAVLEGDTMRPGRGDLESVARAVDEFLGVTTRSEVASQPTELARNVFRRDGDFWTLSFAGHVCRLRDAKGLHHIASLLREPGRSLPSLSLLADLDGGGGAPGAMVPLGIHELHVGTPTDAGALLDAQAKAAYRSRIRDLKAELADAERCNDAGRVTAARAELEFLTSQLAAAVGLGGRDRRAASATERARLTVTKRIKTTLTRIHAHHPALGDHLTRTLRTGHLCAYAPGPEPTVSWEL